MMQRVAISVKANGLLKKNAAPRNASETAGRKATRQRAHNYICEIWHVRVITSNDKCVQTLGTPGRYETRDERSMPVLFFKAWKRGTTCGTLFVYPI